MLTRCLAAIRAAIELGPAFGGRAGAMVDVLFLFVSISLKGGLFCLIIDLDGRITSEDGWEGELDLGRVRDAVDSEPVGLFCFVCIVAECGRGRCERRIADMADLESCRSTRRLSERKGATDGKRPNRRSGGGEMMGVGDQEGEGLEMRGEGSIYD